jgi:hypothetical protein
MWTHGILVLAYLLVRASERSSTNTTATRSLLPTSGRASSAGLVASIVLLVLGPWVAYQWQPDHVPIRSVSEQVALRSLSGSEAMVELVAGAVVEETILLGTDDLSLSETGLVRDLCLAVPFVTFGRDVEGSVLLEVTLSGVTAARSLTAAELIDWDSQQVCISAASEGGISSAELEGGLLVRITGSGAAPGSAPGVVAASERSGLGALVSLPGPDGERLVRRAAPLALDVGVTVDEPIGWFDLPLERSSLVLPWLALLLGLGAVIAQVSTEADALRGR